MKPRAAIVFLFLAACVAAYAAMRYDGEQYQPRDVPLNWDMSGHYLQAQMIKEAVAASHPSGVARQLRQQSLYPPGFHLLLGSWQAAFGGSISSLKAFLFCFRLILVIGVFLGLGGFRSVKAAAAALATVCLVVSLGQFGAYSQSFMIDAHGAAMAVLALALTARACEKDTLRSYAAAGLAVVATTLLKYNVGLPLLASLGVLGVAAALRKDGPALWKPALTALAAAGLVAAFLTWQTDGWRMFLQFARNRATDADLTALQRGLRHAALFADVNFAHGWLAALVLTAAAAALALRKGPFALACGAYVGATFLAVANHPYVLERLQMAAGVVLTVMAGVGLLGLLEREAPPRLRGLRRGALAAAAVAGAAILVTGPGKVEEHLRGIYPPRNESLAALTRYVRQTFAANPGATVLGTFNEFSKPWVELLWFQEKGGSAAGRLRVDLDYPGSKGRTCWSREYSDQYEIILKRQMTSARIRTVIAIDPIEDGPWWSPDYVAWCAWKRNYSLALRRIPGLAPVDSLACAACGIDVVSYRIQGQPVLYGDGWLPGEGWGRWACDRRPWLVASAPDGADSLVILAANVPAQPGPQGCTVLVDGVQVAEFSIDGPPWKWKEYAVALPRSSGEAWDVELRLTQQWQAGPNDRRLVTLAVKDIYLR